MVRSASMAATMVDPTSSLSCRRAGRLQGEGDIVYKAYVPT